MSDLAISTVCLTKRYGEVSALEHVNIQVRRGEVYGFLGLNGAGKSTTIRLLLGMVRATSGSVEIFGLPVGADTGSLYDLPDPWAVEAMIERLGLREYAGRRAGALSLGNLQRLGLARGAPARARAARARRAGERTGPGRCRRGP